MYRAFVNNQVGKQIEWDIKICMAGWNVLAISVQSMNIKTEGTLRAAVKLGKLTIFTDKLKNRFIWCKQEESDRNEMIEKAKKEEGEDIKYFDILDISFFF